MQNTKIKKIIEKGEDISQTCLYRMHSKSTPELIENDIFEIIIPLEAKATSQDNLKSSEKSSEKILNLMKENNKITIKELAEKIGISTRAIEKNIENLKSDNKLKRAGSDKGGYWEII